jgi:hypothetical protein
MLISGDGIPRLVGSLRLWPVALYSIAAVLLGLLLAALGCGHPPPLPAPPAQRVAYCGSPCWNDAYCTGQGFACEHCLGGECSGSQPVANREDRSELEPATPDADADPGASITGR